MKPNPQGVEMSSQKEMDEYLYMLRNGFTIKNREKLLKLFFRFAEKNKHIVINAISQVHPCESEIFWNFLEAVSGSIQSWGNFILDEFARLLCAADVEGDPSAIISSLEAFEILFDKTDNGFQIEIGNIIKAFMATESCGLKKFLIWLYAVYTYKLN